jgi:hypothetical protein
VHSMQYGLPRGYGSVEKAGRTHVFNTPVIVATFVLLLCAVPIQASSVDLTVYVIGTDVCSDGIDNDSDGDIDFPSDSGCSSTSDSSESGEVDDDTGGSSGGGGGGGAIGPVVPITEVIFRGRAYPLSDVTLLKNAQVVALTKAGPDAKFEIRLSGLSAGSFTFGVFGEDSAGRRSLTQSINVALTDGASTVVSGIFLPPTIAIDKVEVRRGDILNIFGYSVPDAVVTVLVNSEEEITEVAQADEDGVWLHQFDTLKIDYGLHNTRARAVSVNALTTFSKSLGFAVGKENIAALANEGCTIIADLNDDCRVNLVDFSIEAFWYKRPNPLPRYDFNNDGFVDLTEFSIMAFYWTG